MWVRVGFSKNIKQCRKEFLYIGNENKKSNFEKKLFEFFYECRFFLSKVYRGRHNVISYEKCIEQQTHLGFEPLAAVLDTFGSWRDRCLLHWAIQPTCRSGRNLNTMYNVSSVTPNAVIRLQRTLHTMHCNPTFTSCWPQPVGQI